MIMKGEPVYEDRRATLAKAIFNLTFPQQEHFRDRFPPGITDWQLEDAIEYANRISEGKV